MYILPDANFCIEECKKGTPHRNMIILASETDYMLHHQTAELPYPIQLLNYIAKYNNIGIVRY